MKRIFGVIAFVALAACSAAAQESAQLDNRTMQELKLKAEELARSAATVREGAVMAQPVLGAPFAATEVNESNQSLADGTKIHRESSTQIYRDGAGRTRRDTGNTSVIMDPVAKVRYSLNHERKTAIAMPMTMVTKFATTKSETTGWVVTTAGPLTPELRTQVMMSDAKPVELKIKAAERQPNSEELGTQTMEGVVAQGSRTTRTIPVGEIGNDRPINITSERWYSPQLQTIVMTKQNDPRTGENVFRLSNVKLGEPDPSLFQVPAGYQLIDRK
jgi:hypothetical protein